MMDPEEAVGIYQTLMKADIQIWLTGGWGIDALLGRQSRPHKDLDAVLLLKDFIRMDEVMNALGYSLKELWSENRWVTDEHGRRTATAYVLQDPHGHEFDAHAFSFDDLGNGIPAWEDTEGLTFRKEDLAGEGMINGHAVKCLSADMQIICHRGYTLPEVQQRDLDLLRQKYGINDLPLS